MAFESSVGADDLQTPFDSVFKTECKKLRKYLVPLIEEMFGLDCELVDSTPDIMPEEHHLLDGRNPDRVTIIKKLSDNCVRIGSKIYHVECQSTRDGDILVRLAEYNMMVGLENSEFNRKKGCITIELPRSSLMMLREGGHDEEKFSSMEIKYEFEGQSIAMNVPVMNVQSYSLEEIYLKKLFFLIPFYAIRYEDAFKKLAAEKLVGGDECDKIYLELRRVFRGLERAYKGSEISEDDARNISELSGIILRHLTVGCTEEVRERMVSVMGGQILELQEDRWLKQGEIKGEIKGKIIARYEDGMPISMIAEKSKVSEDFVNEVLMKNGLLKEALK